jgi:peroxiredoxin
VRPEGDAYPEYPMRHAYLIDPNGVIQRSYDVKDVAAHAGEVLADLESAQSA